MRRLGRCNCLFSQTRLLQCSQNLKHSPDKKAIYLSEHEDNLDTQLGRNETETCRFKLPCWKASSVWTTENIHTLLKNICGKLYTEFSVHTRAWDSYLQGFKTSEVAKLKQQRGHGSPHAAHLLLQHRSCLSSHHSRYFGLELFYNLGKILNRAHCEFNTAVSKSRDIKIKRVWACCYGKIINSRMVQCQITQSGVPVTSPVLIFFKSTFRGVLFLFHYGKLPAVT